MRAGLRAIPQELTYIPTFNGAIQTICTNQRAVADQREDERNALRPKLVAALVGDDMVNACLASKLSYEADPMEALRGMSKTSLNHGLSFVRAGNNLQPQQYQSVYYFAFRGTQDMADMPTWLLLRRWRVASAIAGSLAGRRACPSAPSSAYSSRTSAWCSPATVWAALLRAWPPQSCYGVRFCRRTSTTSSSASPSHSLWLRTRSSRGPCVSRDGRGVMGCCRGGLRPSEVVCQTIPDPAEQAPLVA